MEPMTTWTNGHTQTVLCVDSSQNSCIASGGEGGQMCLWTADGKMTYKRTFPSEVDVGSVCFSTSQPSVLYVAAGTSVEVVDVRCPAASMARFAFNKDDVNQLAVDPKETFLAACDDDGTVRIIDVQNRKLYRTLRGHKNICSSVCFHPREPRELASGGLDCLVNFWEVTKGRPLASINTQDLLRAEESTLGPYTINPPFVHSVHYSGDGEYLACGLENARVEVLERKGKRHAVPNRTLVEHTLGVTQVRFVPAREGLDDNLLLTAGNDCRLILWDIDKESMSKPDSETAGQESSGAETARSPRVSPSEQASARDGGETVSGLADRPHSNTPIRCCAVHKDKINWIEPMASPGGVNLVLVADTSQDISVYRWKL